MSDKEIIKEFLSVFPYVVVHEKNKNANNMEHFFCVIDREHIKDSMNTEVLHDFFNKLHNDFPLNDLSKASKNHLEDIKNDFYFVLIDTLNRESTNFLKDKKLVMEHANNILSINSFGEAADIQTHLSTEFNKYFDNFKEIGLGLGIIAKDVLQTGLEKGKLFYEDKSPAIQKKATELKSSLFKNIAKIKNKF